MVRIGHEETRRLLLRDDDPARPAPTETFQDRRTLDIGGERIELAWHGANHSPDNILIHLPDHDTLMLVDIVNPGWAPVYISNLTEDIPGYLEAPANALAYPGSTSSEVTWAGSAPATTSGCTSSTWPTSPSSSRKAIDTVDPTPYFVKYGANSWAAVKGYWTRSRPSPQRRSSPSTPACWQRPTCSPPAPPSGSWSRSASTSATAPRCTLTSVR